MLIGQRLLMAILWGNGHEASRGSPWVKNQRFSNNCLQLAHSASHLGQWPKRNRKQFANQLRQCCCLEGLGSVHAAFKHLLYR